jgi:hypothetical protein
MKLRMLIPAAIVLILAACAKPPAAEMEAANAAVAKAAQNSDIAVYASDTLQEAQDKLTQMQAEADAKHYDKAKALALDAASVAEKAASVAASNKERVKTDAASIIADVKKANADALKTIASAKKVRVAKLDFASIDKGMQDAGAAVRKAEADYNNGDYMSAKNGASDAQAKIADFVKTVSAAIQAATKKK